MRKRNFKICNKLAYKLPRHHLSELIPTTAVTPAPMFSSPELWLAINELNNFPLSKHSNQCVCSRDCGCKNASGSDSHANAVILKRRRSNRPRGDMGALGEVFLNLLVPKYNRNECAYIYAWENNDIMNNGRKK